MYQKCIESLNLLLSDISDISEINVSGNYLKSVSVMYLTYLPDCCICCLPENKGENGEYCALCKALCRLCNALSPMPFKLYWNKVMYRMLCLQTSHIASVAGNGTVLLLV